MLFKSRTRKSFWRRVADFFWPRTGIARSSKYIWHRVARLPGTPHSIAAGFASGAAVSFTPFLGFHFLLAFGVAWATRGNLLASAIGTAVGNPWTFPLFFAMNAEIGIWILGGVVNEIPMPTWSWGAFMDAPLDYASALFSRIFPIIIGGIPSSIIAWIIFYAVIKTFLVKYRSRRALRRKVRSERLAAAVASMERQSEILAKATYDETNS